MIFFLFSRSSFMQLHNFVLTLGHRIFGSPKWFDFFFLQMIYDNDLNYLNINKFGFLRNWFSKISFCLCLFVCKIDQYNHNRLIFSGRICQEKLTLSLKLHAPRSFHGLLEVSQANSFISLAWLFFQKTEMSLILKTDITPISNRVLIFFNRFYVGPTCCILC